MKENKYGVKEVANLTIYDEDGNFITKLDTLRNSIIQIKEGKAHLFIEDALLDIDLMRFIHGDNQGQSNDFDSFVKCVLNRKITFRNKGTKECKLIAESYLRNAKTGEDEKVFYVIPSASIYNGLEVNMDVCNPSVFDAVFDINPNPEGELFDLHFR